MAKNFRIHDGADVHGWDNSVPLGKKDISKIKDPDGHAAHREITSIPSPFARMDLVNTAFGQVAEEMGLDGDTIFHKMVSDALDVGQLFFSYDKFKEDLEIIVWNKEDLEVLLESSNKKHKILGETYRLFLEQDAKENNFDELKSIYLLNYKKEGLLILGTLSHKVCKLKSRLGIII